MLDHVFTDAIGALRDAMETAMLERQAFEERFQSDVLLGDLTWESSYSLPGEGLPPRSPDEPPRIEFEIVFRVQRLVEVPQPKAVIAVLPEESAAMGRERLRRSAPT